MKLNDYGRIVDDEWYKTPIIRPNVFIDEYVIMPDHFHGIIGIRPHPPANPAPVGATCHVAPNGFPNDMIRDGATPRVAPNDFPNDMIRDGATPRVAPTIRPNGPKPNSVGAIIGQFKSQTTIRINVLRFGTENNQPGASQTDRRIWQRNYYDRIIRDDGSLERIRNYIINNPSGCI